MDDADGAAAAVDDIDVPVPLVEVLNCPLSCKL
jgi:hypothetical protein